MKIEKPEIDLSVYADQKVTCLRSALSHGAQNVSSIPGLLKAILKEDLWKHRFCRQVQKEVGFQSFAQFVSEPAPEGLGSSVEVLLKFCQSAGDTEAVDLIVRASKGKHGGDRSKVDIINLAKPDGTSAARALIDLEKKRPDLHERVVAGEISPHGAMVEAGLRCKTYTIPDDPARAAATIKRHFSSEEVKEIARLLTE